jgi:hygromycin-B 4-O-kinase
MNEPSKKHTDTIKILALRLIEYHYPGKKITIEQLGGGSTNFVFSVKAGREELVVRINEQRDKINFFLKEQWATAKAREIKIPVPDILEVGNSIIPLPYMISKKIEGNVAIHHPDRLAILFEMGKLAAAIHTIPTQGYGKMFDWSQNSLSKNDTWRQYLVNELKVKERMDILKSTKMIRPAMVRKLTIELNRIMSWEGRTCLHHGDLRLKNIMVNEKGKITAIIDWEECISSIGPLWDISIALHDLSIDGQQQFLMGYGMSGQKLIKDSNILKTFNLLNYAPVIQRMMQENDKELLSHYKARLHGALDMFSM